ncbi:MAG: cytochrome c oxidase assembly factor Coa1 family protein [Bacteroidota bacterium]
MDFASEPYYFRGARQRERNWVTPSTSRKFFEWGFRPRHLVIIAILLVVVVAGAYLTAIQSDSYAEAVQFALSSSEVTNSIGTVAEAKLRFWDGFHVSYAGSGGDASFVLDLKGKHGTAILDIRLTRAAERWRVEQAYLRAAGKEVIQVYPVRSISTK